MNEEKLAVILKEIKKFEKDIETRLAKLEKGDVLENTEGVKPEPKPPIRPRAGRDQKYWIRDHYGDPDCWHETGADYNNYHYATGNYFLTKEACQAYCTETNAKEIALQKIKDWIMEKGYKSTNQKSYPCYDHKNHQWCWYVTNDEFLAPFFLGSNDDRDQFLRDCEEELNVLIGINKS